MTSSTSVDWARLLADVEARGIRLGEISRRTGIAQGTLRGYLDGGHPNHWRGEVLIRLWCSTVEATREQLPRMSVDSRGNRITSP